MCVSPGCRLKNHPRNRHLARTTPMKSSRQSTSKIGGSLFILLQTCSRARIISVRTEAPATGNRRRSATEPCAGVALDTEGRDARNQASEV